MNAVDYIAELRQAASFAALPVGRRVVVIGGGNTAIDIAVQTRRLGAEDVTLVYRRGPEAMGATAHEQEFAQINGVKIKHWAKPLRLTGSNGHVAEAVFEYTADGGRQAHRHRRELRAAGRYGIQGDRPGLRRRSPAGRRQGAAAARGRPHRHRRRGQDLARRRLGGRRLHRAR